MASSQGSAQLTPFGEELWKRCEQETDAGAREGKTIPYPREIQTLYRFARRIFPDPGHVDESAAAALNNMFFDRDGFKGSEICAVLGAAVVLASKGKSEFPLSIDLISKVLLLYEQGNLRPFMVPVLLRPSCGYKLEDARLYSAEGYTALHMAAACGNQEVVNLLLPGRNNKYELLQKKTSDGCTALHLCSSEGHVEIVEILMEAYLEFHKSKGEDVKLPKFVEEFFSDKHGSSPLHYAVWNCQLEVVEQLLKKDLTEGVITNLLSVDCFFLTPLHVVSFLHVFLLDPKKTEDFWTDERRLELRGFESRAQYEGKAVRIRDIAETLLEFAKSHKCSISSRDRSSYPPLHWAVPRECINSLDRSSYTPLHWAVRFDATELVKLFLDKEKHRIDLFAVDVDGKTPLHVAVEKDHTGSHNILMSDSKVRADIHRLHRRRAVCVESINTILIGASLISSLTFAAYLQPPLGWVPYYKEKRFSDTPPGPGHYRLFAAVGLDPAVRAFWILDCLAFFSSIATVLASTQSVMRRYRVHLKDDVNRSEKWVHLVSGLFQLSVLLIMGAFCAVGIAALPDNFRSRKYFVLPFGVLASLLLCIFVTASNSWGWAFTGEKMRRVPDLTAFLRSNTVATLEERMSAIDHENSFGCDCLSRYANQSFHDRRQAAILRGFRSVKEVEKALKRGNDDQLPKAGNSFIPTVDSQRARS